MNWTISKYVFLAALVVTVALPTAQTASAAPIIVGKYYEENAGVGCGASSNGCALFFTAVPAGKILLITRLSCLITEEQNRIVSVTLGQRNGTNAVFRRQYFDVSLTGGTAGLRRFAVNGEAELLIGSNIQPGVQVVTDLVEATSFECQIVGQLNPPVF
jgi:hypothetical protein